MRNSVSTIAIRLPKERPSWTAYAALAATVTLLGGELYGVLHALARIVGRLH